MREALAWGLVLVLVLVACSQGGASEPVAKPKARDRQAQAEAAARAEPARHRSVAVGSNELVVVDVPVAVTPRLVGFQTCYVWRDTEFKTATVSCPNGDPVEMPVSVGAGQSEH